MTTLESSSAMDSSMEDNSQTLTKPRKNQGAATKTKRLNGDERNGGENGDVDVDEEECDAEVWETLSKSFRDVQSVLDQNRALIQQVNENHQSKIPDNMVKNVSLIREINGNISKVINLYSDLSVNFSNIVHQRRSIVVSKEGDGKVESTDS